MIDIIKQLSLAHFCELHGPTSVLCTQAIPTFCSLCWPSINVSRLPSTLRENDHRNVSPYSLQTERRVRISWGNNRERCHSCRMSLPEDMKQSRSSADNSKDWKAEQPPLRSKGEIHICSKREPCGMATDHRPQHINDLCSSNVLESSCHTHSLEYISNPSPTEPEIFSQLRRATVRTLSGEQLPRGQTSGPLWFGDAGTGYTIAYIFKLSDAYARGRLRHYALLALVGRDIQRAFESCTLIWSLFEEIAVRIVRMAEEAKLRTDAHDSPEEYANLNASSLLTRRTKDPDGFPRHGVANLKANGLAELVDNENFFCELHIMFAGMLQNLSTMLGGSNVRYNTGDAIFSGSDIDAPDSQHASYQRISSHGDVFDEDDTFLISSTEIDRQSPEPLQPSIGPQSVSACSPALTIQRRQVAV